MSNWQFWISIAVGMFNTVLIAYLQNSINKFNRAEDKGEAAIKTISDKLHEASTKLIDERFRAITHQMNNSAQGFVNTISRIETALGDGVEHFQKLGDRASGFDVKLAEQTGQIKGYIHEQLSAHERGVVDKFNAVNDRIGEMKDDVNELKGDVKVLASKVEGKHRSS